MIVSSFQVFTHGDARREESKDPEHRHSIPPSHSSLSPLLHLLSPHQLQSILQHGTVSLICIIVHWTLL